MSRTALQKLLCVLPLLASSSSDVKPYCIVGAGPAGIQLGHFFKHAKRDYVIFERAERAGSFFEKYPRHRELISLNKRVVRPHLGSDWAFRHDWNSLIDVRAPPNQTIPMTSRTTKMWPHASILATYVQDFAKEQRDFIQYGTAVLNIARVKTSTRSDPRFELLVERQGAKRSVHCRQVIVAGGFVVPRSAMAAVDGAKYVESYESVPETGEKFEGKGVMVLGLGNAALETAKAIQPFAADVHVLGRPRPLPEGGEGVRYAHLTHYVGDIRAGRTGILDHYQLKSVDHLDFEMIGKGRRLVVIPCLKDQLCYYSVGKGQCLDSRCEEEHARGGQDLNYEVQLFRWRADTAVDKFIRKTLSTLAPAEGEGYWIQQGDDTEPDRLEDFYRRFKFSATAMEQAGADVKTFGGVYNLLFASTELMRTNRAFMNAIAALNSKYGYENGRYPMHHIIRCFGWVLDQSIFDQKTIRLTTSHNGKYPQLSPTYEAEGVPGLFFAGTLTHSLDFRKSSGGFIHGFRYTARALFRTLERDNYQVPWPGKEIDASLGATSVRELTAALLGRINNCSGPYQMLESLGDAVVFEKRSDSNTEGDRAHWTARYLYEVPLADFHDRYINYPRLWWVFKYGEGFYGPKVMGKHRIGSWYPLTSFKSTFVHPKLSFSPAGVSASNSSMSHWLNEDVTIHYENQGQTVPLRRYIASVLANVTGDMHQGSCLDIDQDDVREEADLSALLAEALGEAYSEQRIEL